MLRCILALFFAIALSGIAMAANPCANGNCPRPVRSIVAQRPTLAPARPQSPVIQRGRERSVVVRRGFFHRGPGLFAQLRFKPSR